MLLRGDKILVAHGRLFEKDDVRSFVVQIEDYEAGVVKAKGHSHIRDVVGGLMIGKAEHDEKLSVSIFTRQTRSPLP